MKIRMLVLGSLIFAAILFFGHGYSSAQSNEPALKIGVVSVDQVLRDCKATANYREQSALENAKMLAEQDKLEKEIQALQAGLKLGTLKIGSSDYLSQHWDLAQKQAELEARQEFNPQQQMLKQQLWTQQLYQKVLQTVKELALEKDLLLVLERSEPEFPIQRDLGLIIGTHKVLYSGGCLDITKEVIARLDAAEAKEATEKSKSEN
ncbi:MAG: OmpH family outer membrane protein [Sedimentisphaerales bacterium]|nr:OmpH family outer membrane protein [Sedimentisphaerales bacterium]